MKEDKSLSSYIPGQCNIGPEETKRRLRLGYFGLALMILFIILAEIYHIPPGWKLFLFVPSAYALSGFLQARQKFCFLFGFFGIFSLTGARVRVAEDAHKKKDFNRALLLAVQVVLGSSMIALLYYLIS